jgi:hypothetical protein
MTGCYTCGFLSCRCSDDQSNWRTLDEILEYLAAVSSEDRAPRNQEGGIDSPVMVVQ